MTIITWTVGWLFGIWLGASLDLPTPMWIVSGLVGLGSAVLLRRQPAAFPLFLLLAAAGLGAARYNASKTPVTANHIAFYNGYESVIIHGLVAAPPDIHETYQALTVQASTIILQDGDQRPVTGRLLLRASRSPLIPYGTRITAAGKLEEPDNTGPFDYRAYLAHRGIYSQMSQPAIRHTQSGAGNPLRHALLTLHTSAQLVIQQLLPQPQAALLAGILLGDDHAIPRDLQDAFAASGMTHIIAISGFNIAIIAGALLAGWRQVVGVRIAAWIAIMAVVFYAVFVGAEASVVRAAVMGVLVILAVTMLGRPTYLPAVLFSAAFFMTLLNPHILWDVGFQLSFAATFGLTLYLGPWSHSFHNLIQPVAGDNIARTSTRFVTDVVLATFAATIMTFPLLVYHFKTISLVNPLANLLILPAQPGIMTWGGLATLAGMVSPLLGQLPAWVAWLFLTYTIELVEFFGSLPFATYSINMPVLGLVGSYAIIFAATALSRSGFDDEVESDSGQRIDGRVLRVSLVGLILVALLAGAWLWQRPDGRLHVAFLDVGEGDAILIQGPDGKQMLVDGGQYPSLLLSRIGEQLPFWDKEIDLVVATHPDRDHVAGLVDLFSSYHVGMLLLDTSQQKADTGYVGLLRAADQAGVPIHDISTGESIDFGAHVRIEIVQSGEFPAGTNENDESTTLRLVYDNFSLLLPGDAGQAAEQALVSGGNIIKSTVLKAGHHGSNTSSSSRFLEAVNPQIVIISTDGEKHDHPHAAVLQRIAETGAVTWRTDQAGTIELISDGQQIWTRVAKTSFPNP